MKLLQVMLPFTIVFLSLSITHSSRVLAMEFKVIKGTRYALCRDLEENLTLFPNLPPNPKEIPLHPRFKDFRKLVWEILDPLEHIDVVRESVIQQQDYLNQRTPDEQEALWRNAKEEIVQRARHGDVGLERTKIDINHDGVDETVYRYGYHKWPAAYPEPRETFAWTFHVLKHDQEKASRQMRRYAKRSFDAFYYRGRIFLTSSPGPYINVIEPRQTRQGHELAMIYVCKFAPVN